MASTLPPGLPVTVSQVKVSIISLIGQGGMGSVYSASVISSSSSAGASSAGAASSTAVNAGQKVVLKRIATNSAEALREVGWEVQVMKRLRGHSSIVNFISASVYPLRTAHCTHETFILMELCSGGGLIDLLNCRLKSRMSQPEVLAVFSDVAAAVAVVHSLPLVHRDLKVENVLLALPPVQGGGVQTSRSATPQFKLCDFGSCAVPLSAFPADLPSLKALETDLNKNTTMFYRSPEMCDVFQRRQGGITQASDVWALGVLLYKLCYYTTPFENASSGKLAIMNASYSFPQYPVYSNEMREMIGFMLRENSADRPDISAVREVVDAVRMGRSDVSGMFMRRKLAERQRMAVSPDTGSSSAFAQFPSQGSRPMSMSALASSSSQPQSKTQQQPVSVKSPTQTANQDLPTMDLIPELSVVPSRRGRPTPVKRASPSTVAQNSVTPVQAVRAALDNQDVWAPSASVGKWKPPAAFGKSAALPSSATKPVLNTAAFNDNFVTQPSYSKSPPQPSPASLSSATTTTTTTSSESPSDMEDERKFPSLDEFSANFASSSKSSPVPSARNFAKDLATGSSVSTISTASISSKFPPPIPSKSVQLHPHLSPDHKSTRDRALSVASSTDSDVVVPEDPGSSYIMERNRKLNKPPVPALSAKPTIRRKSISLIEMDSTPTTSSSPPVVTEAEVNLYRPTQSQNRRHSISNLVSKYETLNSRKPVATSPKRFSSSFSNISSRSSSPSLEIVSPRPTLRLDSSPARRWMTSPPNVPIESATSALGRIVRAESQRFSPKNIDTPNSSSMPKEMDKPFAGVASMISRWESRPTVA